MGKEDWIPGSAAEQKRGEGLRGLTGRTAPTALLRPTRPGILVCPPRPAEHGTSSRDQ
jgi:hypothetical protein